jgi:hypothetical protein
VLLRRLALPLVALTALGLATTGCADQSAAAKVGDQTLSENDLMDEVKWYADNDALFASADDRAQVRGDTGTNSYTQQFVGQILQRRVQNMLISQLFENENLDLSDGELDQIRQGIESDQDQGPIFKGFPKAYQDQIVETSAQYSALSDTLGQDGLPQAFIELVDKTDIEISSRYGQWDKDNFLAQLFDPQNASAPAITPPAGPIANPEDDGSGSSGSGSDSGSLEIPQG